MAEKSALNAGIGGHTPLPHLTPTRPCPLGEPTDLPRPTLSAYAKPIPQGQCWG